MRNDRESASLWIRHLKKVLEHSSALGIPDEDENVRRARQALNDFLRPANSTPVLVAQVGSQATLSLSYGELLHIAIQVTKDLWPQYWILYSIMLTWVLTIVCFLGGLSLFLYADFHGIAQPNKSVWLFWFRLCFGVGMPSALAMAVLSLIHIFRKEKSSGSG